MAAVATQITPASSHTMEDSTAQTMDRPADLPRPYKCPLCPKAFHRLEHQTRHIRTHTGEKPHACQFPGCTKRFSRSDELTRHSRIHNNPNSRRNNKTHHAFAQAPSGLSGYPMQDGAVLMPPPPPQMASRSAPQSQLNSPDVSPPHSFVYTQSTYAGAPPQPGGGGSPTRVMPPGNPPNINMLARAAHQVERDAAALQAHGHTRHPVQSHAQLQYAYPGRHSSSSLSAFSLGHSHSTNSTAANSPLHSRSHSPTRHFETPLSTAPSSPTFSHNSISPTPDHTPLATPAHSPRLRPYNIPSHLATTSSSSSSLSALNEQQQHQTQQQHAHLHYPGGHSGVHLPSLRQLSLGQLHPSPPSSAPGSSGTQTPATYGVPTPHLAPMEPSISTAGVFASPTGSGNNTPFGSLGTGGHLADIMSRTRGEERKLPAPIPVPRVISGEVQPYPTHNPDAMDL